jgi:hypothetical protein
MEKIGPLIILDFLRKSGNKMAPLDTLLDNFNSTYGVREKGKIPYHTGGGLFAADISNLTLLGLIEVWDINHNNISTEILQYSEDRYSDLNYKLIERLGGKEKEIFIVLTPKLESLQAILGISISKMIHEFFNSQRITISPFFGIPSGTPRTDIFVLMPFKEEFKPIYEDHIVNVCNKLNCSSKRADHLYGSREVMKDIWELIHNSNTIVADCTERNPNVFYELGIAHTLGKKVIIITQNTDDIPFDIRHIRYIKYEYTPRGMKEFETTLEGFIGEDLKEIK